jgi:nucleoside-diphosphate-sugar epimerase
MSKLAGTNELARRCVTHGLKGVTGRLFSVYGPGEAPARLLPTLIDAAGDDRPIALTQGLHSRDFVYVEDAAQGLLRLAVSSPSQGEVVNVATGKLTSVRTFVETAAEIVGIDDERLRFGALPTRAEEMAHLPVNVERLGTLTGWLPPTTIASGVMRSVLFRNARQQAKAA